ncbi:hypothetical protein GE21DRAFT_1269728 [Neurospora crassa]|nr:hypothetical protein GE21DRAFT_1269728 [Neurospora crassa]
MAATGCRVSSEPLAVEVWGPENLIGCQAGVRPARSRATARTGWRDATSRPSLFRGHLASARSPLYEKDSGTVTGVREEGQLERKAERSNKPNLPPAASTKKMRVLKAFRPKPTAESSTPIQRNQIPSGLVS